MEEHVFEEIIKVDNEINSIKDVLLDHEFNYLNQTNGIVIKGTISISFIAEFNENEIPYAFSKDIELFVSLNEIDSLKDITLEIDHFDYVINNDEVQFKIYTKLKGNKEDLIFFELSPNRIINDNAISLLMRNINKLDKHNIDINKVEDIEKLIKTNSIDLISTSSEFIDDSNDIIEFSTFEDNNIKNETDVRKDDIDSNINSTFENNIILNNSNLNISVNDDNKDHADLSMDDDSIKVENNEINNQINKKEELFKETYISTYFFYIIKENDTKNTIINTFKVDEEQFDKLNSNIVIKKGNIVRIPK